MEDLSEGRAKLRIRELPWTKIRGFDPCATKRWASIGRTMREAARRQGHRIGRPDHILYYAPCFRSDGIAGVGELPGDESWVFAGPSPHKVAAHELGHNYGLHHAGVRRCRAEQFNVPDSDNCFHERYHDLYDLMGSGSSMSAVYQARLGWLGGKVATIHESGTRTLVPVQSSVRGLRGLRVVGPEHTWWVDVDRVRRKEPQKYPGGVALHVRRKLSNGDLELWNLVPKLNPDNITWAPPDVGLPPSSTWTTPDGVRLDVLSSTREGVRVKVDMSAPAPQPPAPPSAIRVETLKDKTVVTFAQSADDNGAPIWGYDVSSTRGGVPPCDDPECYVPSPYVEHSPGRRDSVMNLLDLPARPTRIEVRAISAAGWSRPAFSEEFVPRTKNPVIELHAAVDGPTVSGMTELRVTASPNPDTGLPLSRLATLYVDGESTRLHTEFDEGGRTARVALGSLPNGPTSLMLGVSDERGRSARSEPIEVVVDNPVVRITSPLPGERVSHLTPVTYEVLNRQDFVFDDHRGGADAEPRPTDPELWAPEGDDGEVLVDAALEDGPFTIELTLFDDINGDITTTVPVVADNPVPTVAVPEVAGSVVSSSPVGHITSSPETWPWDELLVRIDGTQTRSVTRRQRATTPVVDAARLSEGDHTIEVVATDLAGRVVTSGVRTFTVQHPELSAQVQQPADGSVVSGRTGFVYTPLPSTWVHDEAWVEVEGLGAQEVRSTHGWDVVYWDTETVPNGSYRARVVVADPAGNQGASEWLDLVVLNTRARACSDSADTSAGQAAGLADLGDDAGHDLCQPKSLGV